MDFINNIIRYSLHNRLVVLIGALLVVVGGYFSSRQMDMSSPTSLRPPWY